MEKNNQDKGKNTQDRGRKTPRINVKNKQDKGKTPRINVETLRIRVNYSGQKIPRLKEEKHREYR
jgi:hypothetical protein